jgi:transcriptional regulator of acetoin/glycerol metabolism
MNMPIHAALQKVAAARRAYFEQGVEPDTGVINQAIYRSWNRCVAARRREQEPVVFDPVGRSRLSELMDRNNTLLMAAKEPINNLAKAVSGAGYAVLLTDSRGYALSVGGVLDQSEQAVRVAFRCGVDLSERAIGTSAMSCALAERTAVRVFGPEHFFSANQLFHCAAAPIIDPSGEVVGAIDVTRDTPLPDYGALSLVSQCAQAIERQMFRQLPAYLTLKLSWQAAVADGLQDLILAFGVDGEIIALNETARRVIGLGNGEGALRFEDIFEGQFSANACSLLSSAAPAPLRLRSGLCLFASGREFVDEGKSPRPVRSNDSQNRNIKNSAPSIPEFGDPGVVRHIDAALRALRNDLPLLILGETGTGKEVVAKALHAKSGRATGPFIAINCAAIPESLIEGLLFGYVDGAYTGARRGGAVGQIELAHGGTLFLDEIGDMPLHLQARLLRVLESREVSRLGETDKRKVDIHLICATHQNLPQAIRDGRFRQDLYYRINGFILPLSPLRVRPDLPALARSILDELSGGNRTLSIGAVALLQSYEWPGNTRELKHALAYAHSLADGDGPLEPAHFPSSVAMRVETASGSGLLQSLEQQAIEQALSQANGNVPRAARLLGVSRTTLYRRLRQSRSLDNT